MSAAEKLEYARSVCAEIGVPLSHLNVLAVDVPTAGRLLGEVSPSTVKRLIAAGELSAFKVANCTRIELTELVDFMERNRVSGSSRKPASARARAVAFLDGADA